MAGERFYQPAVQLRRRHAPVPDLGGTHHGAHELVETLLARGRDRDDGDAGHLGQPVCHFGDEITQVLLLVLDQVPLIDGDDERAAFLGDVLGDGQILMLERALGIDDDDDDLGEADSADGVARRKLLGACR